MFELSVSAEFEAAHRIEGYPGKCHRLHGHNWVVEVGVIGDKLNDLGMLVDFKEMKKEVNRVLDHLDHQYLNELPAFTNGYNPTAEHIAKYVYDELKGSELLHAGCRLKYVKIWESPKSSVIYSEGEQQ